jgi:hypothetical protein
MIIIFSSQYSNSYIAMLYFLLGVDIPSKCAASFMEGEERCITIFVTALHKESFALKYLDCYLNAYF